MNRVIALFVSIFVHSEDLHNMHSSPNIWQIKSRRMKWVGHVVAHMGEERKVYKTSVRNPEGK
jgi:hypothetical protein